MSFTDKFEQYQHHGKWVWVRKDLKGKHRENCLCFSCQLLDIDNPTKSCPVANHVFSLCVLMDMVLPVWECPFFVELPQ